VPLYEYQCPAGHTIELSQPIADPTPSELLCEGHDMMAARVWAPPAAIHFKGAGFYSTDVKGAQERRRRPNPGDDLHRPHDPAAAKIARSL
jgi:predicted nucleic acid-binding Zn ribbon protein